VGGEEGLEAGVVRWLDDVGHLVDDDIFEELRPPLRQLAVEPQPAGARRAATPAGFHPPHAPPRHLHAEGWFPGGDERADRLRRLVAVPGFKRPEPGAPVGIGGDREEEPVAVDGDPCAPRAGDDVERAGPAPHRVVFTGAVVQARRRRQRPDAGFLRVDPGDLGGGEGLELAAGDPLGRGDDDMPVGGADDQPQPAHPPADDGDLDAVDDELRGTAAGGHGGYVYWTTPVEGEG
jgi:hypothetical protein